jgi:hypothetical protein
MKKYIGAILSITSIGLLFYTLFDLKNQVKQIPILEKQLDSLNLEIHLKQVQLGKYEMANEEVIKAKNKKLYEEYTKYLETME